MLFAKFRREYHRKICKQILHLDSKDVPNNADRYSDISIALAKGILNEIGLKINIERKMPGQTVGRLFEKVTSEYLEKAFTHLHHLRPGKWQFTMGKSIEEFEQYEHLAQISKVLSENKELRATLGDYLINPDIVVGRYPVSDAEINQRKRLISSKEKNAVLTPLRNENSSKPILHASISCKWTIRSDRAQNSRTEGLNLIRNRKGKTPHIVIITAEPYPQRIASLALGTGDIDCVYHFALQELKTAAMKQGNNVIIDMLDMLISGKRLRDIGDLPFDLAI